MRKPIIILSIPIVLVMLFACKQEETIQSLKMGTVTDISYMHGLSPGTTIRCEKGAALLDLVKIVTLRDGFGAETIVIGESSPENSRICYMGMENERLMFRLFSGGESLDSDPDTRNVVTFPKDRLSLDLWGTEFEVLHVTADEITCRLMPPTTDI